VADPTAAPAPYTPPSQTNAADLVASFEASEGAAPSTPAATPSAAPAAATPAPEAKPAEDVPALLKIAQARDAFRKESEPLRPYLDALKVLSPTEAQRLAKARADGDPVAALAAMGFTHSQYTQRLLGQKDAPTEAEPESKPASEYDALKAEVAQLKAERENEKVASTRTQVLEQMKGVLKDSPKFALINKLGDYEGVERTLIQYHAAHGALPGSTLGESVTLAAEMYESQLKKEADRWSKVLTGFQGSAPVEATKAPESPSTGTVQNRTLTNANTSAPAAARTVPKTREEILAAIIEDRDGDLA